MHGPLGLREADGNALTDALAAPCYQRDAPLPAPRRSHDRVSVTWASSGSGVASVQRVRTWQERIRHSPSSTS